MKNNLILWYHRFLKSPYRWLLLAGVVVAGCSKPVNDAPVIGAPADAYDEMQAAAARNQWEQAWKYADDVLIAYPKDSEKLARVAEVAFRSGRQSEAADLLVEAAAADDWASEERVHQAFTGLLAAGRLHDAIELLRSAIEQTPERTALRRLLSDLLVATEQHREAAEQRRALIKAREFDLTLLHAASSYDRRFEEIASLQQMLERNPSDLRPQLGEAKQRFDSGLMQEAADLLVPIVNEHPQFLPAQMLLGRAWVQLGQYERLAQWSTTASAAAMAESDFWLTMGDWAMEVRDPTAAIECYGQAAKLGPDRVAPWQKLAALATDEPALAIDSDAIGERAALLMRLRQNYAESTIRGVENPDSILALAQTTMQLGWLWEAEAWAAIGLTMSPLDSHQKSQLESLRQSILTQLKRQTPWDTHLDRIKWDWLSSVSAPAMIARLSGDPDSENRATIAGGHGAGNHFGSRGQVAIVASQPLAFANEAVQRGLTFFGRSADDLSEPGVLTSQMLGCGGGTIDFDLDGWPDVYLVTAGGTPPLVDSAPNAMFRNRGGHFQNVSAYCDARDHGFGTGVCVGDVNEDGFDDLLVLNYGPNRIWINNGDGTFTDHSEQLLPPNSVWSTSAAIADLNSDGLGDLVIANYCVGLEPATLECQLGDAAGVRSCSPNQFLAEPDNFYAATRRGTFRDVGDQWGATPAIRGRGLGVVAGALDETLGTDVLVANDMTTNHYWTSVDRDRPASDLFQLAETGTLVGLATDAQSRSQGSMGIAVGDFNGDQIADFYTSNYADEYNMLSMSQAGRGWRDRTASEKIAEPTIAMVGFGTQSIDFDHNGVDELIVTNGHVDDFRVVRPESTYAQPLQLFRQATQGEFEEIGANVACEYFQRSHIGRALWTIDANRDGRVDVLITHQSEPTALLVNHTETGYASIGCRLVGRHVSRGAVGSVVTIRQGGGPATKFVTSGDGYLCSNERCTRFGLGGNFSDVEVEVQWPSGKKQTWPSLGVNRQWLLVEDDDAFELTQTSE